MSKNQKGRASIFLYLLTFLTIYTPTLFSSKYINYALPFVYLIIAFLFLKRDKNDLVFKGIYKSFAIIIIVWILASLFIVARALAGGISLLDIENLRFVQTLNMISVLLTIFIIERHLTYLKYGTEQKIQFMLNITVMQFATVVLMLIFPTLRANLLNHFYAYGAGNNFTMEKRVYGILFNYTYAGPIFHGILASIALTCSILYNKKYLLYIPMLVLMIILNGRTGLLIFILGALVNLIFLLFRRKYFKKVLTAFIIMLISIPLVLNFIKSYNIRTYNFLMSGLDDVYLLFTSGEKDGNIKILSKNISSAFNLKTLILGLGFTSRSEISDEFYTINFVSSDVGYINDMYLGGLLYMLMLYLPIIYFILKDYNVPISNENKKINFFLKIFLLLTIFVCNIKGDVFRSTILMATIIYLKLIIYDVGSDSKNEENISYNVNL